MIIGLDIFKKYFEAYPDNYLIIGGTARDIIIEEAGFIPKCLFQPKRVLRHIWGFHILMENM